MLLVKFRTTIVDEEVIRKINQDLMFLGHRPTSRSRTVDWFALPKAPSLFFTDGQGFVLAVYMLREFDTEIPFHPVECDVLNLLNICAAQQSANSWCILKSFVIKCHKDGIAASAHLFFYFFYSRWTTTVLFLIIGVPIVLRFY